ncbi:TonB-dependent receptor [Algoriphagus zhangzhouensis]|uniref:Iron complex outermembrane recepter protein n=1 Tax=Algoriphagus zhangzhouensis TaxID=1073327 RepID=A0A1M7ZIU3_9BACT|nr:TonB-dependent receptor [Algoriphagus zhangzhouensis]TDY44349.1 iron complex outermembrane receptor protein [Algoriphagus zhangzhouensis]SHO64596.1 iron complex outermembrane recepter protein [Algoriphagus zhangzhouensis]
MRNPYPFLLSILFVLFINSVLAQTGSIQGKVTDQNGSPLEFVNVLIKNSSKGAISNSEGKFTIDGVGQESVVLTASMIGFEPVSKQVQILKGEQTKIEFVLNESQLGLQTVEITGRREVGYDNKETFSATKTASLVKDVPSTINFVTKELILDQVAFTVNDVVKNVPGVNQFTFYNDITIRGFRIQGQRNSGTLLNGMRTFTSFWKPQLIPHIERVEVIKGPASALFGNASPGGSINRVTKKPLAENRKSITTSVGSFNTVRALADFTGAMTEDKKLLYRLNLGYENSDGFRDLQFKKNLVIAPSFAFLPTANTSLNFDLVYQDSKGRLDRGQAAFGNRDLTTTPITTSLSAMNDYLNEVTLNSTVSLRHNFSENISLNSTYQLSSYSEDLLEHRTSNQFAALGDGSFDDTQVAMRVFIRKRTWNNNAFNNYINAKYQLGKIKNTALVGYDYFRQELLPGGSQLEAQTYLLKNGGTTNSFKVANVDNYILDESGNPATNVSHFDLTSPVANGLRDMSKYLYTTRTYNQYLQQTHGVYIQNQSEIGPLKILLGLRQEYFQDLLDYNSSEEVEVKQDALLPRVGLVYTLNPSINFYGTWVKGYQPQEAAGIINPDAGGPFDPLTSEMIEVGAKSEWFNKRVTGTLSLYQIVERGGLYNANNAENPELLVQLGEEQSKGVELNLTGNILPNWSIVAGYAFNDAKITQADDEAVIGRQKPNSPRNSANFWSKYVFEQGSFSGLGVGLGYNYVSERYGSIVSADQPDVFPSYGIVDAAVYYQMGKVQFQVNANNLLNKTHWVGGYDVLRAFPGSPRSIMTTVSYTF